MTIARHPSTRALREAALARSASLGMLRHVASCAPCEREMHLVRALSAARLPLVTPCPDEITLVLAADGQLDGDAARQVSLHLAACVPCTAVVEALDRSERGHVRVAPAGRLAVVRTSLACAAEAVAASVRSLAEAVAELASPEMPVSLGLAMRSSSRSAPASITRGLEAYRAGRFAEARALLERAIAEGDASAEARFFAGACLRRAGHGKGAVERFREAVTLRPDLPEYRWHLAQALLAQGLGEEALAELQRIGRMPGTRRAAAREQARKLVTVLAQVH